MGHHHDRQLKKLFTSCLGKLDVVFLGEACIKAASQKTKARAVSCILVWS